MIEGSETLDLSKFKKGIKLGEGSFGEVFVVTDKGTMIKYAAKISFSTMVDNSDDTKINLLREVNINAKMNHPSILRFLGFSPTDFNNESKPVIITELSTNGPLSNIIEREEQGLALNCWDSTKKLIMIFGIASGMAYLHSHDIIHRDLKPENILTDDRLFPKIADFGLSKSISNSTIKSQTNIKGTPAYISPEIFENKEYSKAGDVYAFGIIVYEIMMSRRAYEGLNMHKINELVVKGERLKIDSIVPLPYRNLIEKCWPQNPSERLTFDEIVDELQKDEFITPAIEANDYLDYIDFIETYQSTFDKDKKILKIEDFIKDKDNKSFQKVSISQIKKKNQRILPMKFLNDLNESCKKLVDDAVYDEDVQYLIGTYLIEGSNGFPKNIEYGIKYLELSDNNGCVDSGLYLSELYYKGELIPINKKKAKDYLYKYEKSDNSQVYTALGKILKEENNLIEAKKYFQKGSDKYNSESMFILGSMLICGEGDEFNTEEGIKLIKLSKNQGYELSQKYLDIYDEYDRDQTFSKLPNEAKYFLVCSILENNHKQISFLEKSFKYFFETQILELQGFIEILKTFSSIFIELTYPSELYNSFLETNHKYKEFSINLNLNLLVLSSLSCIEDSVFSECSSLTQISFEIPSFVNSIGNLSFDECSSLTQIIIPSSVSSIGEGAFRRCTSLKEILISSSVTKIGDHAFNCCSKLAQVSFENHSSLILISNHAFEDCIALEKISIPSSVTSIKNYAFSGCKSLTQILIPSSTTSIGSYAFNGCSSLIQVSFKILSFVISIGEYAFCGCKSLKQFAIPSSVVSIEDNTFDGCSSLTQIIIPSSVTSIGNCAFEKCSSLKQIKIPYSVTSIKDFVFKECSLLEHVSISTSIVSIGYHTFDGCSKLDQIIIPSSITSIRNSAFYRCSSLTKIIIPASVTKIDNNAFNGCSSLAQLLFENSSSVSLIGDNSFKGCSSLTQITIPTSVTKIGNNAFNECLLLTRILFENSSSVSLIGNNSFKGCSSLAQITIPASVTKIDNNAFNGCSSLAQVLFENSSSVSLIGDNSFKGCSSLTQITIPASVTKIDNNAFDGCSSITQILFEIPSSISLIGDNSFKGCSSLTQITIPTSVTSIGCSAFSQCSSLTQISIPYSVKEIGESAFIDCVLLKQVFILDKKGFLNWILSKFITYTSPSLISNYVFYGCSSLTQITIPSSVTSIGDYAFYGCSNLTQIAIPSSVTEIGDYAFYGCSSLIQTTISSSVTSIGSHSFTGCSNLTKIAIPSSVTSIGSHSFTGCSNLTKITIPSSVISIGDYAFSYCKSMKPFKIPPTVKSVGYDIFEGCAKNESSCNIQ